MKPHQSVRSGRISDELFCDLVEKFSSRESLKFLDIGALLRRLKGLLPRDVYIGKMNAIPKCKKTAQVVRIPYVC